MLQNIANLKHTSLYLLPVINNIFITIHTDLIHVSIHQLIILTICIYTTLDIIIILFSPIFYSIRILLLNTKHDL